jgi:hypothetical protein
MNRGTQDADLIIDTTLPLLQNFCHCLSAILKHGFLGFGFRVWWFIFTRLKV